MKLKIQESSLFCLLHCSFQKLNILEMKGYLIFVIHIFFKGYLFCLCSPFG